MFEIAFELILIHFKNPFIFYQSFYRWNEGTVDRSLHMFCDSIHHESDYMTY